LKKKRIKAKAEFANSIKTALSDKINISVSEKLKKEIEDNISSVESKIGDIRSSIKSEKFKKIRDIEKVNNLLKAILLSIDLIMK